MSFLFAALCGSTLTSVRDTCVAGGPRNRSNVTASGRTALGHVGAKMFTSSEWLVAAGPLWGFIIGASRLVTKRRHMFYLHTYGDVGVRIKHSYDQFFYYRWCLEAFTALADHAECTRDYNSGDYSVASSTLRCVSFAAVHPVDLRNNLAGLITLGLRKKIVVFDLTDHPWPNFRGRNFIVCKSAYHERYYSKSASVAIPQFPRYTFDDNDVLPASARKYLVGFKGNPGSGHVTLRRRLMSLNNDRDIIIKGAVLTDGHIRILSSGRATENVMPNEMSYENILSNAKFALLPRACGYALSYRMVECMNLGCVPVIISDGYVLPFSEVLDYERFSIRLPESEIERLPDILRERESEADRLQVETRRVYRDYFSTTAKIMYRTLEIASRL